MATISATLVEGKSNKIRILISHKGVSRYIVTDIEVDKPSQFRDGLVIRRHDAKELNNMINRILDRYREILANTPVNRYTCDGLKKLLEGNIASRGNVSDYLDERIEAFSKQGKHTTAEKYKLVKMKMLSSCGDMPMEQLSLDALEEMDRFMKSEGLSRTTINIYMTTLAACVNRAIKTGKVKYAVSPFVMYKAPRPAVRDTALTVEQVRKIRDAKFNRKGMQCARDMFMLSYYMAGINFCDLMDVDFREPVLEYSRKKTRERTGFEVTSFKIPKEALEIANKYMDMETGQIKLHYKNKNALPCLGSSFKYLSNALGFKKKVTYYAARKSFLQQGFELGIPLEILEYCAGQTMKRNRPIFSYVRVMRKQADEAIQTVIHELNKDRFQVHKTQTTKQKE